MKKTVVMLLVLLFAVSFAFSSASSEASASGKKTYTVGICNFVDDASLNQICENIQNQLAAIAEKKGVVVTCHGAEKIPVWYNLYKETSGRDRISIHPESYYQKLLVIT